MSIRAGRKEVYVCAIRRILADDAGVRLGHMSIADLAKAISCSRRKKYRACLRRAISTQGSDIVENVNAAPVSGDHQIVEALLNRQPVNRSRRQIIPQAGPVPSIIPGNIDAVVGSKVEHALAHGILDNAMS